MWSDIIKSLLELLKNAPRYLIAVAIVCGLLLFSPPGLQKTLGVESFVSAQRQWLGLALIGSLGIWLVTAGSNIFQWVKGHWDRRRRRKRVVERLNNLTEPEKQILRYYFAKNTRGNKLRIESGDVQALRNSGIIYQSASLGSLLDGFAHNITDFAWNYINSNPHVLEGSTNTYHTDEQEKFW